MALWSDTPCLAIIEGLGYPRSMALWSDTPCLAIIEGLGYPRSMALWSDTPCSLQLLKVLVILAPWLCGVILLVPCNY